MRLRFGMLAALAGAALALPAAAKEGRKIYVSVDMEGCRASTTNPEGVRAHTMSSATYQPSLEP